MEESKDNDIKTLASARQALDESKALEADLRLELEKLKADNDALMQLAVEASDEKDNTTKLISEVIETTKSLQSEVSSLKDALSKEQAKSAAAEKMAAIKLGSLGVSPLSTSRASEPVAKKNLLEEAGMTCLFSHYQGLKEAKPNPNL